jgi:hypothetical protein
MKAVRLICIHILFLFLMLAGAGGGGGSGGAWADTTYETYMGGKRIKILMTSSAEEALKPWNIQLEANRNPFSVGGISYFVTFRCTKNKPKNYTVRAMAFDEYTGSTNVREIPKQSLGSLVTPISVMVQIMEPFSVVIIDWKPMTKKELQALKKRESEKKVEKKLTQEEARQAELERLRKLDQENLQTEN